MPQTPAERWRHAPGRREHPLCHVVAQEGALHHLAGVCAVRAVCGVVQEGALHHLAEALHAALCGGWPAGVMTAHWTYQ